MNPDVLVIGSGFGACAPALRLVEAGARVHLLEKGPRISTSDFRQTQEPTYYQRFYRKIDSAHLSFNYVEALGGASGFYEMASFRAPSRAFTQTDPSGRPLWPASLNRAALDPYYERAEAMLSVHQIPPERVPRNGLVFAAMMKALGYSADRGRYAVRGCLDSGYCLSGCIYGAKQSLLVTYLPAAEQQGLQITCDTEVMRIRPVSGGYEVIAKGPDGRTVHQAPVVVLAGGTIGSARVLMRSAALTLSDHLGRHLTHNGCTKVAALLGDQWPDGELYRGRSHAGMVSYHFLESHGVVLSSEKPLPLQMAAAARIRLPGTDPNRGFWGESHDLLLASLRTRGFVLAALGLCPPDARLVKRGDDVKLQMEVTPELTRYVERTDALFRHILDRSGCTPLEIDWVDAQGMPYRGLHLSGAHQMGSARMADAEQHGVVDANGQVFGHEGLYVTDGSVIPSALGINPSLTILANAERIADHLVARHG